MQLENNIHLPSILAGIAIGGLLLRLLLAFFKRKSKGKALSVIRTAWTGYVACFFSGVLFANAVPHFVHGISGEHFPAPFGFLFGNSLEEHLTNVMWGFINIVLGYNLFLLGKVSNANKIKLSIFFAGILAMSSFLCIVFSH